MPGGLGEELAKAELGGCPFVCYVFVLQCRRVSLLKKILEMGFFVGRLLVTSV